MGQFFLKRHIFMNRSLRSSFVEAELRVNIGSKVLYKEVTIVCIQGINSLQFNGLFSAALFL